MEFKMKDGVDLHELEKFGFHTFTDFEGNLHAVRDNRDDKCHSWQYYRIGIRTGYKEIFRKSKFRGCGKCLLPMSETKNDVLDILEAGLIERVRYEKRR